MAGAFAAAVNATYSLACTLLDQRCTLDKTICGAFIVSVDAMPVRSWVGSCASDTGLILVLILAVLQELLEP